MEQRGQVEEISNDQRETISTMMVLTHCATQVDQILVMTSNLFIQCVMGLTAKYGYELRGLDPEIGEQVSKDYYWNTDGSGELLTARWSDSNEQVNTDTNIPCQLDIATDMLNKSRFYWGRAHMILRRVNDQIGRICVSEKMLDQEVLRSGLDGEIKRIREYHAEHYEQPDQKAV